MQLNFDVEVYDGGTEATVATDATDAQLLL
jgi:hypothetical protein